MDEQSEFMLPEERRRLDLELAQLNAMTPDKQRALVAGQYVPEELAEFGRTRDMEEGRLRGQIDQAYQMANTPIASSGRSTPEAVANMLANTLRTFGGYALAGQREGRLSEAQAESARQHAALLKKYEDASNVALDAKRSGLAGALERYGKGQ